MDAFRIHEVGFFYWFNFLDKVFRRELAGYISYKVLFIDVVLLALCRGL